MKTKIFVLSNSPKLFNYLDSVYKDVELKNPVEVIPLHDKSRAEINSILSKDARNFFNYEDYVSLLLIDHDLEGSEKIVNYPYPKHLNKFSYHPGLITIYSGDIVPYLTILYNLEFYTGVKGYNDVSIDVESSNFPTFPVRVNKNHVLKNNKPYPSSELVAWSKYYNVIDFGGIPFKDVPSKFIEPVILNIADSSYLIDFNITKQSIDEVRSSLHIIYNHHKDKNND